jgi:hypothetical protein
MPMRDASLNNVLQQIDCQMFFRRKTGPSIHLLKDCSRHDIETAGRREAISRPSWGTASGRIAVGLCFLFLSASAAAQITANPNSAHPRSPFAAPYPDLLSAPPAILRTAPAINGPSTRPSKPIECNAVSIESTDPWISTADVTTRILATPEFVLSGIKISRDAEHADVSLQLDSELDDDGTRIEYLTATSAKMNLEERVSFLWPATDHEEFMSAKVLKLLFTHCIARRNEVPQQPQLPPELVRQRLLAARTIKPVIRTSWMRDNVFLSTLEARPEFARWGIKIAKDNEIADFGLVVGHVLTTLTWTFSLIDTRTGALMDSGTVMAFHDDRAAARISAAVVKQISERRPLPALPSTASQQADYAGMSEIWEVKAVSEDTLKSFPEKMRFLIRNGIITATDLKGATLFSISTNEMVDFADTEAYDTVGDRFRLDADGLNGCDDGCAVALLVYVPILLVLDQFHIPLHIFEIAWMEDDIVRVGSFRVSRGDYQNLLTALKVLLEARPISSQ